MRGKREPVNVDFVLQWVGASQQTLKCFGEYWEQLKNMKSLFLGDLEGELRDFVFLA